MPSLPRSWNGSQSWSWIRIKTESHCQGTFPPWSSNWRLTSRNSATVTGFYWNWRLCWSQGSFIVKPVLQAFYLPLPNTSSLRAISTRTADSHFFFFFIWLRAGYWSVKTLLPMLWGISQHLDKRALRKCCHPRQPWQDFPLCSTAMDFKQHCGHDEHNVWRAVAARSCGPEKVKEWGGF